MVAVAVGEAVAVGVLVSWLVGEAVAEAVSVGEGDVGKMVNPGSGVSVWVVVGLRVGSVVGVGVVARRSGAK